MDVRVRRFIHSHLWYGFVEVADRVEARRLGAEARVGALRAGPQLLNPLRVNYPVDSQEPLELEALGGGS
jgi:hypothetical protein